MRMNVVGIPWHAVTTEDLATFESVKKLFTETIGARLMVDKEGYAQLLFPGSVIELYGPGAAPDHGFNGGVAFGFMVDDIEAASVELEKAGAELLGTVTRVPRLGLAYRYFRGPDGRVYGLNERQQ